MPPGRKPLGYAFRSKMPATITPAVVINAGRAIVTLPGRAPAPVDLDHLDDLILGLTEARDALGDAR